MKGKALTKARGWLIGTAMAAVLAGTVGLAWAQGASNAPMSTVPLPPLGTSPGIGDEDPDAGTLPTLRGSTAGDQPADIGVTPSSSDEAAQDESEEALPDEEFTPDTESDDFAGPMPDGEDQTGQADQGEQGSEEAEHDQSTVGPMARAPAEPGGEVAVLRGLDKITARVSVINAPIGKPVVFGRLKIVADYCHKHPPELTPEVTAFVQIDDTRVKDPEKARIFSGWMFATSPALNAVEHPVYDVWLIDCKTSTPESEFGTLPKEPTPKEDSSKQIR